MNQDCFRFCFLLFSNTEPYTGQMYAGNISARSPPRAVEELSCKSKKSRGSVWDRLGKPCEETVVINDNKTVDTLAVDVLETEKEVYGLNTIVDIANSVRCESMKNQGHDLHKSGSGNIPGEHRKLELGVSMIGERHAANNIGQKRHFGGIYNETSKDSKRLNSKPEAAAPALVTVRFLFPANLILMDKYSLLRNFKYPWSRRKLTITPSKMGKKCFLFHSAY